MSRIDDILRRRGHEPSRLAESATYEGFTDSGGAPQMGFTLTRANGAIDAFFYHNLDNLDLRVIRGNQYLNFTHRGKAVTLQGTKLDAVLKAILNHTLTGIVEYDGQGTELDEDGTIITRSAVTMVNLAQESASAAADDMADGMHPR